MKKVKIILIVVLLMLVIPVGGAAIYTNLILDKMIVDNDEQLDPNFDLMINENLTEKQSNVMNIALFGLDCRNDSYEGCRSDVMMVVSYNLDKNEVTVSSVVRDTYVEIGNRGFDKINHAYAFGGPQLAIQTINRSFDLNIKDYVTVDFWAVEAIIDAVGGVEIDVDAEELPLVNGYLKELNDNAPEGDYVKGITATGLQTLNGRQAVAYMRIRYVGDGDFERMQRQREVMSVALEKVKDISLPSLIGLTNDLISTIQTSLSKSTIIDLLNKVVTKGIPTMNQFQLPTRNGGVGSMIDGIYYFVPNTLLDNVTEFHELIYPDTDYVPSDYVSQTSKKLEQYLY